MLWSVCPVHMTVVVTLINTDIEDLTHKTGNFKQFTVFISMLESALSKVSCFVPDKTITRVQLLFSPSWDYIVHFAMVEVQELFLLSTSLHGGSIILIYFYSHRTVIQYQWTFWHMETLNHYAINITGLGLEHSIFLVLKQDHNWTQRDTLLWHILLSLTGEQQFPLMSLVINSKILCLWIDFHRRVIFKFVCM